MTTIRLILFATIIGFSAANWSLSGYACNQPQIYQQCNCQSFCSPYVQQDPCGGGCGGGGDGGYPGGYYPRRRHRPRHRHHKKPRRKFRFESSEEDIDVPPPAPIRKAKPVVTSQEEGFIEESSVTNPPAAPETTVSKDGSWENEDLWEKKFEANSHKKLDEEEFPDFSSTELEETAAPRRVTQAPVPVQQGAGAGQGIGVNTGLGVGAPGVGNGGGLGLGNGGLFGISSGVGVGVPGVGPIGVSSGLGIGK